MTHINEIIVNEKLVLYSDGIKFYNWLRSEVKDNSKSISISFKNVKVLTTAFLNASVGNFLSASHNTSLELLDLDDKINRKVKNVRLTAENEKRRKIHNAQSHGYLNQF